MASMNPDPAVEKLQRENRELATKWLAEIERRRVKERKWREKAVKVIRRYRDDRDLDDEMSKYNILYANTETLKPAIMSRMPVPDVRRRFNTRDPAARTAALILERSLSFCISSYNFKDVLERVREDYVLPGRAIALVCYEPLILTQQIKKPVEPIPSQDQAADDAGGSASDSAAEIQQANASGSSSDAASSSARYPDGTQFSADGSAYQLQPEEYKAWESVYTLYVPWNLFGFSDCTQWSKVPAVWIGEYMTKEEVRRAFPDFADIESLSFSGASTNSDSESDKDLPQPAATVLIWKVWQKGSRKYMAFAQGYQDGPIKMEDDPQQLENFYPIPEPLYAIRTNNDWCPKPEYTIYQDQAIELDNLTNRLANLVQALKVRGVYDQAMDQVAKLSDIVKKPDNTFMPVPNFRELAEKGGLEALLSMLPLEDIAKVILHLKDRQAELKQEIYEIYGIADIMRGATEASETLGAQQLKAQYGGLRISTRQERFQEFIREIFRIKAELIAEHFSPDTLRLMCGIQVIPDAEFKTLKQNQQLPAGAVSGSEFNQAVAIIRSDKLRGFKVDIETDSTIPVDRAQDQQNRVAFIQAIGQYLQGVIPAVQEGAIPMKVAREGLLFVVRGFKVGTELEEVLEELGEGDDQAQQLAQLQKANQMLQQQLQELQKENAKLKGDSEANVIRAQSEVAIDRAKATSDIQLDTAKTENDIMLDRAKAANSMQIAASRPKPEARPQ